MVGFDDFDVDKDDVVDVFRFMAGYLIIYFDCLVFV